MPLQESLRLNEIMLGATLARAVSAVAELGIPDLIERGSARPVAELATETGCHERALYRCLRFLASHGIFAEQDQRSFALTPLAEELRTDSDYSYRAAARMSGDLSSGATEFDHCLKTEGSGFTKAFGKPLFEFLADHPERAAIFDAAMTAIHGSESPAMLDAYDFSGIGKLADVGGGNGSLLTAILQRHPEMNGMLFDLGHVSGRANANLQAAGLSDRCEVQEGNFFESFPEGADAYLMRHIIHDWTDEQCIQILRNCRAVMPAHGRVLVVESVVPPGNDPSPAKDWDIIMLVYPGGMERTEEEYRELFAAAGFELAGVTPTASPVSVIEGRPV